MPRLTDYEFPAITRNGKGRSSKYPYTEWFDGSVWEIKRGKDFETTVARNGEVTERESAAFALQLRSAANKHGVGLKVHLPDEDTIVFQATEKRERKVVEKTEVSKSDKVAKATK